MHGSVMMFLFAIPIFEAIAVMFLPQMLGARDLPFPRLSAFGFWCFLLGGIFLCGSIFFDAAPRGGWFMYPPLTSTYQPGIGADIWLLGFSFIEVAAIAAAVELIVGVLKCRPPGMRINLIPLYCLVRAGGGGDDPLRLSAAHRRQPAARARARVPLAVLRSDAAAAIRCCGSTCSGSSATRRSTSSSCRRSRSIAMIVPTFARTPIVGYSWIVLAAVGTGFLSFGLWVHHMFTTGLPGISLGLFSAASEAVAIPTGVQIFCFIATLAAGRVTRSVPMLFTFGGLAIFVLGGLTGVMVALAPFDFQAHDTLLHRRPSALRADRRRALSDHRRLLLLLSADQRQEALRPARDDRVLAHVRRLQRHVPADAPHRPARHAAAGVHLSRRTRLRRAEPRLDHRRVHPRRRALPSSSWDIIRPKKQAAVLARAIRGMPARSSGCRRCRGKPWGVRSIPEIDSRYPLWDQPNFVRDVDEGRFYLPDAEEGKRETLVTSVDRRAAACSACGCRGRASSRSVAALSTGGFFIFGTFTCGGRRCVSAVAGDRRHLCTGCGPARRSSRRRRRRTSASV